MPKNSNKAGASEPKPHSGPSVSHAEPSNSQPGAGKNPFPELPEGSQDLERLHDALGKPPEKIRHLLFRHHDENKLFGLGVRAATDNILADAPRFVSSSLHILSGLGDKRRALVKLPPAIFSLLVDEAVTLDQKNTSHKTLAGTGTDDKVSRETNLKREMAQGVELRDRFLGCLRSALGADKLESIRKAASDASSAEAPHTQDPHLCQEGPYSGPRVFGTPTENRVRPPA